MKSSPFAWLFIFLCFACSPTPTPTATPDMRATETQIASNIFATQTASAPTATRVPTATPTILATKTITPTVTRTATRTVARPPNTAVPKVTSAPLVQDQTTTLLDRWQVTLVSTRRDKAIYGYSDSETAFGVWVTLLFKVKNLQAGSDYIGKTFGVRLAADGKRIDYSIWNTAEDKASYFYSCCESSFHIVHPGTEQVVLYTFDVPEATQTLDFNFTVSTVPILPSFRVTNVPQIQPRKLK